jgi:D-glycero-D-manno-heptose 1,7-bisphosphate phosphatase
MINKSAVFLDRDGTINEEVGYLDRPEKLKIIPGAFEAIRRLNQIGLKVIVVTNQSGIARGFFDEAFVLSLHEQMRTIFLENGAVIDGFYYCPHHPTAGIAPYQKVCACRKPEPGLLMIAAKERDVDLETSYMIGDLFTDVEAGQRAGAKGILVRTGYGQQAVSDTITPDYVADDILEAVDWILADKQAV